MIDRNTDREIKTCCATFYQSDTVRMLLGDVLHPGGLALTQRLGESMELGPHDRVLDVACGRGVSAIHLAHRFGCHVTGLDYGPDNITAAEVQAADEGLAHLTAFRRGDAEGLPFQGGAFDGVISECSFCTFPDKGMAASEMARVLRPGGRLGLTDMTVSGPLPDDILSLLSWVACVAGAAAWEDYVGVLRSAGFTDLSVEDHHDALLEMVAEVRRRLLGVELALGLGRMGRTTQFTQLAEALDGLDLTEAESLGRQVVRLIDGSVVGYVLITAEKG